MGDFRPLVSGIDRQLSEAFPDEPTWRVVAALRSHVNDPRYLRALAEGGQRHTLDGEPRGPVSEDHREHARRRLAELEGPAEAGDGEEDRTEALRARLAAHYTVINRFRPLARSVASRLPRELKDVPRYRILAALQRHMDDPRYLQALLHEAERRDLDGQPAEPVTAAEREAAYQRLAEIGEADDAVGGTSRTHRLVTELRERFPVLERFQPLASGIEWALIDACPGQPAWRVIAALRSQIGDPRYQRALLHSDHRRRLTGEAADPVTEDQRHHARHLLAQRGFPQAPEAVSHRLARTAFQGVRYVLQRQARHRFGEAAELRDPRGPEATARLIRGVLTVADAEAWRALLAEEPIPEELPAWEWLAPPEGGEDPGASEEARLRAVFQGIRFAFREQAALLYAEGEVARTGQLLDGPLPRQRVDRLADRLAEGADAAAWLAELDFHRQAGAGIQG
jgi:sRNA-binding protein